MSDNAIKSQGTKIAIGSGSPISYTNIPEINSFSGPGGNAAVIDVTDMDSLAKEKRMGLQDEGQITFEINYRPDHAAHAALRAARASQERTPFRIVFTDSGTTQWTFNGFVTSFSLSGGVDNVIKASVTVEISGAITES